MRGYYEQEGGCGYDPTKDLPTTKVGRLAPVAFPFSAVARQLLTDKSEGETESNGDNTGSDSKTETAE